jgi:hypothetical protein
MFERKFQLACVLALAGAIGMGSFPVHADDGDDDGDTGPVKTVFVIAMENHNWTQPGTQTSPQQIFQNPATPFINSLVNGTSGLSRQVAFANAYINAGLNVHPSEPNYIWAEAGTNFGVTNDDDPYKPNCAAPDTVQTTNQHLSAFLAVARKSWRSYQEDVNVDATNTPLPASAWTVPLFSHAGTYTLPATNAYNYSNQFNYAAKHNPMVYFTDTNGGCNTTTSNPLRLNYPPLQQLALDLANDTVADYNWITPNQYNDMHTTLSAGFQGLTGDAARIKQGDSFLSQIIPAIMASQAYQDHGVIVLWWDEAEKDGAAGDNADDFNHTLPFVVISKDAHKNVDGKPYGSAVFYTHSSFLRTMQEIFGVGPLLGDAANATDLSDLFKPGNLHEAPRGK